MEAVGIRKNYGKKSVLKSVSFVAQEGKCTGFIGANGCGKSTLFRILAGVEKADGGNISIRGKAISQPDRELAKYVGYIPQENALMKDLTVKDNLTLYSSLCREKIDQGYVKELCERFSIKEFEKEKVSRLSGGMTKRVSIVCALLHSPDILIMDEPSASLDLLFKEELKRYIREFTASGGSVLISSHDQGEIQQCDRLFAIRDGVAKEIASSLSIDKIVACYIKKDEQVSL